MLSDELTAVARDGTRYVAMGTPFRGAFGEGRLNRTVPLAGLAFLRRAPRPFCRPLAPDDAARRLLQVVMFFGTDLSAHRRLLANVKDLVRRVPAVELAFDRGRPFADVLGMLRGSGRKVTGPRKN